MCVIFCSMPDTCEGAVVDVSTFLGLSKRKQLCSRGNVIYPIKLLANRNLVIVVSVGIFVV